MRTKDEHFKVTPYDDLEVGAIFVAVIELEEFAARCLKAFWQGDEDTTRMFAILGPFMPESGNTPTLHKMGTPRREVIDISSECRIVPDVGPDSLMDRMPERSKVPGKMVFYNDRTLLALRDLEAELAPVYIDVKSGLIFPSDTLHWDEPLTLGRWCIESRRDHDWVREFSYPDIGERHTFSGAELLPEHI